jgi:predicted ATPase/DNA-binding SARP family transcriptional activator
MLGPLVVSVDGRRLQLGGVKEKAVLVLLALRPREVVSSDYLIDQLWGEHPPASATNTLQTYVSRLRKALHAPGTEVLITQRPGYLLDIPDEDIDARSFEQLVRAGQRALADGNPAEASELLRQGLALWRGPPLSDFAAEEFASDEVRFLEEARLTALEARIRAELELGHHREVISDAESLVREHPLREGLWASLMLALYRDGRQAEALRTYQAARRRLGEELGIDPGPELQHLEGLVLQQDPSLLIQPTPRQAWTGNLPADLTSFIGRAAELADLETLARRSRLVTLLGPGGIGKSRLALELARRLAGDFADAAWLADLGATEDPEAIVDELTAVWRPAPGPGAATIDDLGALLRDRQALLVIDNCERVAAGLAPLAEQLLATAPSLHILATSREPLECRGEALWRVGSLGLAEPGVEAAEVVLASDAVELFVARAREALPGFSPDSASATAMARICAMLEGIPLAIELAASRLRSITLEELEGRLDDRLGLLVTSQRTVPARQQTLQKTISWSYDLLDAEERELFGRLSTFWVEFPRRAVEVVCADTRLSEDTIAPVLERLADKSLVMRVERRGRTWYRLLETIRVFAFQKIAAELGEVHERGFFIYLAGRSDRSLLGSVDEMWSTFLEGDAEVARQALTLGYNSFREEEGGELAGTVAALVSKSRRVAFIAGLEPGEPPGDIDRLDPRAGVRGVMRRFRDGFFDGALRQDPHLEIVEAYLTDRVDFASAFQNPGKAGDLAEGAFAWGADVIFQATGGSSHRIFEMARRVTEDTGIHRWIIGVDFDQHQEMEDHLRPHVLASVRKQVPIDVYRQIKQAVAEGRIDEAPLFDLANGGLTLATTGGHVEHIADRLDEVRADIINRV